MGLLVRAHHPHAVVECAGNLFRAAVGRAGIGIKRGEGDGVTPAGSFPLRTVLYRSDRIARPVTRLPLRTIAESDGWCDASGDGAYNRPVKLPYPASAESLWRDDRLYDLIVVVGYNDGPLVAGLGSAIFLHVAREDFAPTEGCIVLALDDLRTVCASLEPGDTVTITP